MNKLQALLHPRDRDPNVVDPLTTYLRGLRWDGQPRCTSWLTTYCGALDSEATRQVSVSWLLQCVSRAFIPGCAAYRVLVLAGTTNIGKSSVLRALAVRPEWFGDSDLNVNDLRGAAARIRNRWIYSLGEIRLWDREVDKLKDFLTERSDRLLPYHGGFEIDVPRCTVFGATTSDSRLVDAQAGLPLEVAVGAELPAGRFWKVRVGGPSDAERCHVEALAEVVPQLWAEAVHRHVRGEVCW